MPKSSAALTALAPGRLTGMDALRAIAIVHVVLAHGAMAFVPDLPGVAGKVVWLLIAANFGVPLFFVLSGFLIARQLSRGMRATTFYRHRLAKIYPTFLMAVLVFGLLSGVTDTTVWLLHLSALHNGSASTAGQMSGHLWSLAVELQFYALAPVLFALGYRWLNVRTLGVLCLVVWAGHAAWLLSTPPDQSARLTAALDVYEYTSFNILALLMGALLYRAYASGWRWSGAMAIGLAAALAMPIVCVLFVPSLQVDRVDLTRNANLLAMLLLISLPPVASVCLAYLTLTRRWFESPWLTPLTGFVAAISYQWYLWHPLVLVAFRRGTSQWPGIGVWAQRSPWLMLCVYGLLSLLLAWLAYRWVERPAHQWLLARHDDDKRLPGMPTSG